MHPHYELCSLSCHKIATISRKLWPPDTAETTTSGKLCRSRRLMAPIRGMGPAMTPWSDAPPLPPDLQVEITSACNLRCTMCLVSYRPPVNKLAGAMTPHLFRRILDEVPS